MNNCHCCSCSLCRILLWFFGEPRSSSPVNVWHYRVVGPNEVMFNYFDLFDLYFSVSVGQYKQLHTYIDVHLLPLSSYGTHDAEIPLVETVHDCSSTGQSIFNLSIVYIQSINMYMKYKYSLYKVYMYIQNINSLYKVYIYIYSLSAVYLHSIFKVYTQSIYSLYISLKGLLSLHQNHECFVCFCVQGV